MRRRITLAIVLAAALPALALAAGAGTGSGRTRAVHKPRTAVSPLTAQARQALFEDSQLGRARELARQLLARNPADVEALFIQMEAAALEADTSAELQSALSLCELRGAAQRDPRVTIAVARLLHLAANTEDFRAAVPRIQALLAHPRGPHLHAAGLRAALLAAAADGAPGIDMEKVAREAGVLTHWRVAGPFGHYPNLEFDQHWAPERDALQHASSDGRAVERLHFADGTFRLPDYFARGGVFYASAVLPAAARSSLVRVESRGTLEVLVDGTLALRKDDRFRSTPEIAWSTLRLGAGAHHVVVKFLAPASPFRVTFMAAPELAPPTRRTPIDYAPEAAYVAAARKYWAGDYNRVITDLDNAKMRGSALADFLVYQAWTQVAEDSPEAAAMLNAALQAAPEATAAEYELAARAYAADRIDEALTRLQRVIGARKNFLPGQELMARMAIRLNWPVLAEGAMAGQVRAHPSCDVLMREYKFLARHARYENARDMRRRLADCAPDTLAYARSLSESGEHGKAAGAAEAVVARDPLDRGARELLVRELAWSGQAEKARAAALELAALAPNSERYQRMAEVAAANPEALLDAAGARSAGRDGFYAKYRRDGVAMVASTNDRKFSGGPAVMLVNDRVARLWEDGSVSVYVHKLTRVLDRDGIEKYGEASLPRGAQVLELRTIQADGTVVEPELSSRKASVSMPALAAGDAIDEEYVVNYPGRGGIAAHAQAFRHSFGSFDAPILYSRFVAIVPAADTGVRAESAPGIAPPRTETAGRTRVWSWKRSDIPQSVEEVATARGEVLPDAMLEAEFHGGWTEARARFRDALVDALRAGPRVRQMAARVRAQEPQARAREIFRAIANSIRSAGTFDADEMIPAEETLARGAGSRTLAVLAVARAAGLQADLVLARNAGEIVRAPRASLHSYSRPLLRFQFPGGRVAFADAETEGMAFGALPPAVERNDALLVPVLGENAPVEVAAAPIIGLPANAEEQSVAEGDITLREDGSLRAEVTIRMGAWRGAQMRSLLAGIEPGQRSRFYQQLAMRIFAGADQVSGDTRNERDPDRPLELRLRCRVPRYVNLEPDAADLDQLVPTLGLKKMYPGASRRFPLYIDTPLVESARFRVHLPPGITVMRSAPELNLRAAFGSYSLSVSQPSPALLEIERSFRIPAQLIAPERFPQFSAFAERIDQAERQRITLARN